MNGLKKITFSDLTKYLSEHHDKFGVIVFKQNPIWNKEFSELSRSYRVSGNCNFFQSGMISNAIIGDCLDNSEDGIRLDWYMACDKPEERWEVDYCYIEN